MGIETDLNVNPYYDDFDETKDFHRVLFKPAVPLQAREITQLQTILQNQVEKFGQFTFKEGSIVKGCTFTYDRSIKYAKILDKDSTGLDVNTALFAEGDYLRNNANLVSRIVKTANGLESQNPDLNTLFFNYLNSSNNAANVATSYIKGEELEVYPASTSIANIIFTGIPNDVFLNNNDTISVSSNLKGTGFSGNVVTTDGTNQFLSVKVNANGAGFSVDDLPTATIVAANGGVFTNGTSSSNTTFDLAAAISSGTVTVSVNLQKTSNVTIGDSTFESAGNSEFNILGSAFQMKVQDGVIFQKGTFQRFAEQDIIVSKYTSRPNELCVGVTTNESFVNSSIDTSLLDNASGFANENAPGADRLKLQPVLVVNTINNAVASNNFLRLVEFQHGMPVKLNSQASLSGLGEVLERRLYETNGDYVVNPLSLGSEQIVGNSNTIAIAVGAGVGYNKGKRFELINTSRLQLPKATSTESISQQEVSINYGNYVEVDEYVGQFGIATNDRVLIMGSQFNSVSAANSSTYDISSNSVAAWTDANTTLSYAGTTGNVVGHARVRAVEQLSSEPNKSNSKFNLYIYDVQMNTGKSFTNDAKSIFHYSGGEYTGSLSQTNQAHRGIADLVLVSNQARILDQSPEDKDLLFPLGQVGIKTISNNASFTYESSASGEFTTGGSDSITKSSPDNWGFGTSDTYLTEVQENELTIVANNTVVAAANFDDTVTINTANAATSKVLTTINTTDVFEGDYVRVANTTSNGGIYQVIKKADSSITLDRAVTGVANTSTANVAIAYPYGRVISLKNRTTANAAISDSGRILTINLGRTLSSTLSFDVLHNVRNTSSGGIIKAYKTSEAAIYTSNNVGANSGPWSLGIADAQSLVKVYVSANSTAIVQASNALANAIANGTMTDRTNEFELVTGQEGSKYGLAKLKLKSGSTYSPGNATLAVTFRHFVNDSGSGYASFQSYAPIINDELPNSNTTITTQEIPTFISNLSGAEYSLRDCVDFRPYVTNTATVEGTFLDADASINPSAAEQISGTQYTSTPNKPWTSDITYYLPRKDRLVLEEGKLTIIRGNPSTNPELPAKPPSAMQLGTIDVPVYPSLDSITASGYKRPDLAVKIRTTQLKRYTMQDIKTIDDRINNLEYYTSLNLLEKQTADEVIPGRNDPTENRFKNGFIVDNFTNKTTGNPLNTEFKAGFDIARKTLTPKFEQYSVALKFKSGSNIADYGDVLTTKSQLRKIIQQPNATQSRRCTSAFWQYNGDITLYPDYLSDTDVTHNPEEQITIDVDIASGTIALLDELNKYIPIQQTEQEIIDQSESTISLGTVTSADGLTSTETFRTIQTKKIKETTKGIAVGSKNTIKKVGEFVTDISFQPYIPATTIRFIARGLRPNLKHYAFFDDVNVTTFVAPGGIINTIDSGKDDLDLISTRRAKQMIFPQGKKGTQLTANSTGGLAGLFFLPAKLFMAGERKFALTDVENLSQISDTVSSASANFNCFNFAIEKGDVNQSTRSPILSSTETGRIFSSTTNSEFQVVTTLPDDDGGIGANTDPGETPNTVFDDTRLRPCEDVNPPEPIDWWEPEDERGGGGGRRQPGRIVPCQECPEAFLEQLDARGINARNRWSAARGLGLTSQEFQCAQFVDPLAQSFLLQGTMFDGSTTGYIRGLDLYFAEKNPTLGALVELREVQNGLPSNKVLPFGKVTLKSQNINTSTDGTVATRVLFKAPVAVDTSKEYAFVIKPEGNNPETKIFTSKAGQNSLQTGIAINQDWGDGSMFLSSNDRTWTPYADEDAKFTIYASHFNTTDATIELTNEDHEFLKLGTINGNFTPGEEVFQLGTVASANISFQTTSANVVAGTTVDLSLLGLNPGNRIVVENANAEYDVVEVKTANSSMITLRGAPSITESATDGGKIRFTPSGTFKQLDANTNTMLVNDSTATNSTFLFTASNTLIGATSGANCVITSVEDTNITYFEPMLYNNVPNRTSINTRFKATHVANNTVATYKRIKTNDRNYPLEPVKVRSKSNEISGTTINKSLFVKYMFASDNKYTAPFVDMQSQSLKVYENIINNDVTNEHITEGGSAAAKYVSRTVTLGDGLDAEDIKVFVNAYKPINTDIKVYAKAISQSDEVGFSDGVWSELQRTKNTNKVSSNENRNDVIEYGFEFKDAPASTLKAGSITFSNNSTTITGTGSNFQGSNNGVGTTDGDFKVGDLVKIDNPPFDANTNFQISMVTAIASNTSMTIADPIAIGDEIDGRQISKVDADAKNTIFRDPQPDESGISYLATYYNTNNEKQVGYKYLAIKIVMTGTTTSVAPYIQDYRALAVSL